jgi:4-hydroxy-tetrahydrodipicolinate reductase
MKIAIVGYGKMGKEIEQVALNRGHDVVLKISEAITEQTLGLESVDVAIEFSRPDAAANNILELSKRRIPVVCGTTGWYNRLDEIKSSIHKNDSALLYSTNFSIGVNIVFHLNKLLASIMHSLDEYDPRILEIHHVHKLDKPSGTAITLAEGILNELKRKDSWKLDETHASNELLISSERTDEVPGTHSVIYESSIDKIELNHIAKNRVGFALGAVKAAEWLHDKKGTYTMRDYLKF